MIPYQPGGVRRPEIDFMPQGQGGGQMAAVSPLQMPTPKKKKGGMFGSGLSIGEVIAHGLMGVAAGRGNTAPLQMYQNARQQRQEAQSAEANRQNQWDDWVKREMWKLENQPAPENPFAKAEAYAALPDDQKANIASYYDMVSPQFDDVWTPEGMVRRQIHRAPQGPRKGDVEGGYEFMGGDPSDQSNWKSTGGPAGNGGVTFR